MNTPSSLTFSSPRTALVFRKFIGRIRLSFDLSLSASLCLSISLTFSLFWLGMASALAQGEEADSLINIGRIDRLQSAVLDEERELWVYVPASAATSPTRQYPVVYLLDGDGHFHSVSGLVRQLSTVNGNKVVPEMIVIGVPNTDRLRDLTPTPVEGSSGGGTAFLDFLEDEVIPHVEASYPASQYRTFIGHSLGGLMVIEALLTRPEVFANYVAIDPSLWWDEQHVHKRALAALESADFAGKSLYVSVANTMQDGMTLERVEQDSAENTLHIRSILEFSKAAAADTRSGLNFDWKYYPDDSHGSVPLISELDAMRFLFAWHEPKRVNQYFTADIEDNPEPLVDYLSEHFQTVSAHFGFTSLPPEPWIRAIGFSFMANDKPNLALGLFEMNLKNFPDSPAAHESLGDYYAAQEDTEKSKPYFERALQLGADEEVRLKLESL